jgi:putative peptidoglycan lipid II flippase
MEGLRGNLAAALRAAALLTLPATAGLIALREPIIRVLFQRGEFTPEDTAQTAAAVLCYGLGLYAYAVTKIQAPTYYALGDSRRPAVVSAVAVGLKIAASLVLIHTLGRFGIAPFLGLALSTSLAAWVNFTLLSSGLRRRIGRLEGLAVVSTTLKILVLSAGMGLLCRWLQGTLEANLAGDGLSWDLARLLISVFAGIVVTAAGAWLLGVPEARTMLKRLRG